MAELLVSTLSCVTLATTTDKMIREGRMGVYVSVTSNLIEMLIQRESRKTKQQDKNGNYYQHKMIKSTHYSRIVDISHPKTVFSVPSLTSAQISICTRMWTPTTSNHVQHKSLI